MTTLTQRSYIDEADLPRIAKLANICDAVDQLDDGRSVEELREDIEYPTFDAARDLQLWETDNGALIGVGLTWIPQATDVVDGFLWLKVHPDFRDGTVEPEILAWAEAHLREVGRERSVPARIRTGARSTFNERITLLERHGFRADRYFLRMARSLAEPIPAPALPDGYTLRHVAGPDEAPAWVDLFNQSFIDHYNHHPLTVEERLHWLGESTYRAEQDIIVVAPDGAFAAFCKCDINPHENERTGRNEGWVSLLGTRRGYRKLGLGCAVLLAGLHRLKQDGVDTALLGVDADSPTGATRLYDSAGFAPRFTMIAYTKELGEQDR